MSWLLCYEHRGAYIFLNYSFVWVYVQEWDCCFIWQLSNCLLFKQFSKFWFSSIERFYRKPIVSVFIFLIFNLKESLCHHTVKFFSVLVTKCLPKSQGGISIYSDNTLRSWVLLCHFHWITSDKISWLPQKCSDCPLHKKRIISKYSSWWFLSYSQTSIINLPMDISFLGETAFLFGVPK